MSITDLALIDAGAVEPYALDLAHSVTCGVGLGGTATDSVDVGGGTTMSKYSSASTNINELQRDPAPGALGATCRVVIRLEIRSRCRPRLDPRLRRKVHVRHHVSGEVRAELRQSALLLVPCAEDVGRR